MPKKWKRAEIIALLTLVIAFLAWQGIQFAVYPGTSSGASQWTLCYSGDATTTCDVLQGYYSAKGKVEGMSWNGVTTYHLNTLPNMPNRCYFQGTIGGHDGCTDQMLTFFSGTRYGTRSGDACMFDEPVIEIFPGCPDRVDITGSVTFFYEEITSCTIASDCEGMSHIECVGHWECQNNECVWVCDDIPEPPEPGWNLKQFILDIVNAIQSFFCTYFGLWC